MPGGLIALLDDVSALTRLAAASADDVAAAASRAGAKTLGVVVDDTAVVPGYVVGLPPQRELPIIWKIAVGSVRNKLLFILPAALLLNRFLPWALTPILMLGGLYLCFEGAEKIEEAVTGRAKKSNVTQIGDPKQLEERQVSSAIRTDLILSTEIMVISLNEIAGDSVWVEAIVLALIGVAVTAGVYGVVALIVKMDDAGRWLAQKHGVSAQLGKLLLRAMPLLLKTLSIVGTAAMLWVGGGILVHGFSSFGIQQLEHLIHSAATFATTIPAAIWTVTAFCNGVLGLLAGFLIVGLLHLLPNRGFEKE